MVTLYFLVTVFTTYGGYTENHVELQPSKEICEAAKQIHLAIPRTTPAFSGQHDIWKPVYVDCVSKDVELKK